MMNFKELKDLLSHINELELKEVRLKDKEFELRVRTALDTETQIFTGAPMNSGQLIHQGHAPGPAPLAPAPVAESSASKSESVPAGDKLIAVKSPMVGTFYRSSSPDKPAYVQVGDTVSKGNVLCIIEAMKLFNEIESEVSGKIVKVLVEDASPVEYDQVLFMIEP